MLNISKNRIDSFINKNELKSFKLLNKNKRSNILIKTFIVLLCISILISFLPWTQNITAQGVITAKNPEHRPQTIHSIIPGRIEEWKVSEGEFVEKGDTIAILTEIKETYFDPNLVSNYKKQIEAKKQSKNFYEDKANALNNQIVALKNSKELKKEQASNKIKQSKLKIISDSIDLVAAKANLTIAENQLSRTQELYNEGLKSLLDLEEKKLKEQESFAKKVALENKLLASKNEYLNAKIELQNIENEFNDKISKSESERFNSISTIYDTETEIQKLENQYTNYNIRSGLYTITAPQSGYITKASVNGIGENIKDGQPLISIMPANAKLAVEVYVKPMDIPLLKIGRKVNLQFDGWPAMVFSGWQGLSFGTFDGNIIAIDNFANNQNKYRVLVVANEEKIKWPESLRVGSGAKAIILLENVPIYYEIWRVINGFPPNFYIKDSKLNQKNETLKHLKEIK